MTQEESDILDWLRNGTIQRGLDHYSMSDRRLRVVIASLQEQGVPVISLGKGYRLGTPEEVQGYCNREIKRAATIFKKIRKLRPQVEDVLKQMELL